MFQTAGYVYANCNQFCGSLPTVYTWCMFSSLSSTAHVLVEQSRVLPTNVQVFNLEIPFNLPFEWYGKGVQQHLYDFLQSINGFPGSSL